MLNKNKSAGFVKKIIIIIVAVTILFIVSFVGNKKWRSLPSSDALSQEEMLAKQMEELENLKQANSVGSLTQEEISKQVEELGSLSKNNPTVTQDQINIQAEELDALKAKTE